MSDQRGGGIAWTEQTWNPVRGCSRVSEGCRNCYAESVARRFSGPGQPYEGLVEIGTKGARWNGRTKFVVEHLEDPLRWKRPRMVFVNSMSDLFHESLTNDEIAAVFGVMASAPHHTFQVLTKRPERARLWFRWMSEQAGGARVHALYSALQTLEPGMDGPMHSKWCGDPSGPWPLSNVWLGVSVEDQMSADARIPLLLETPAAVRWVSYEPALGPVDFRKVPTFNRTSTNLYGWWVIVGGESGPGARPMHPQWVRALRDQCSAAGVPFLFKQWGEWAEYDSDFREPDGSHRLVQIGPRGSAPPSSWQPGVSALISDRGHFVKHHDHMRDGIAYRHIVRVGKAAAGRTLDGVIHDGYPGEVSGG